MNEVDVLKALAVPTRLKILECLKNGERCICEIIPYTGKSQPNVSQHLKVLKNTGLVEVRKEGTKFLIKVSNPKIFDVITSVKRLQ